MAQKEEATKKESKKKTTTKKAEKPVAEEVVATTATEAESPATVEEKETKPKATTKAGKHSAKALKEAEAKEAKEERKAAAKSEEAEKPKAAKPAPKTRSRLERKSKKFREAAKLIEADKTYKLEEALELAAKTSTTKFDAAVELHIRLNVDPRQADQNLRDSLVLPAGTGKTVKIAVFAEADDAAKAKKAGANIAGTDEITKQLDKGVIEFDVLISSPAMMAKLGKYARVLGPRGLMPNPKSGTVTPDVVKAVNEAKAGRVEYRVDSTGIIHIAVGKVSFAHKDLLSNAQAVLASIKAAKPNSIKGVYLRSAFVATTMGPSIRLEQQIL